MIKSCIVLTIILFIVYLLVSGGVTLTDILFGLIVSIIISCFINKYVLISEEKISVKRLIYLIKYFMHYLFIIEPKAHWDVIKRILSPSLSIYPGIVEVPYYLDNDYAITLTANSITNTPGTVVVAIDQEKKYFYVHWIDVRTIEDEKCRHYISLVFEKYAREIFE